MPTPGQIAVMQTRKKAAHSAVKFFSDVRSVRSTNNPFDFPTAADHLTLNTYRNGPNNTVVQSFDDAARTGIGNCDEKGRICFAALRSNPLILPPHSQITLCEGVNYDHVFVVVSDAAVVAPCDLDTIGETAMIVDGWTQDWYFPNINFMTAKWHNLGNNANPRQIYVRVQISRHQVQPYVGMPVDM